MTNENVLANAMKINDHLLRSLKIASNATLEYFGPPPEHLIEDYTLTMQKIFFNQALNYCLNNTNDKNDVKPSDELLDFFDIVIKDST
jgi:hypothetical protein